MPSRSPQDGAQPLSEYWKGYRDGVAAECARWQALMARFASFPIHLT